MSYQWFNRKEIFQKAKERYSKGKAAEFYLENKEVKGLIQKIIKRRKRQDYRVPKKKISTTDSLQKSSINK